jgi:hypothetical protein
VQRSHWDCVQGIESIEQLRDLYSVRAATGLHKIIAQQSNCSSVAAHIHGQGTHLVADEHSDIG